MAKLDEMKRYVRQVVNSRLHANSPLPTHNCAVTNTWVTRHSLQSINDAFCTIRSWLPAGWAANVNKSNRRTAKSIALF